MARRLHDADLCDRIKELEDEVKKLREQVMTMPHHQCYHYYPYWTSTPWVNPFITVTNGTTTTTGGAVTYGNTYTLT